MAVLQQDLVEPILEVLILELPSLRELLLLLAKFALHLFRLRNLEVLHNSLLPLLEIFRLLNAAVMLGASRFDEALVDAVVELRSFSDGSGGCESLGGKDFGIAA